MRALDRLKVRAPPAHQTESQPVAGVPRYPTRGFLLARSFPEVAPRRQPRTSLWDCSRARSGPEERGSNRSPIVSGTPKHGRSTVGDTKAIQPQEDPWGSECLLVPRGGIEPPTRGFSVPVLRLRRRRRIFVRERRLAGR